LEALANPNCGWFYRRNATAFEAIPGSPIAYWISQELYLAFQDNESVGQQFDAVVKGIFTGDNDKFLRYWHEVDTTALGNKWILYAKGGPFRKWYGNINHVINWENNAQELRSFEGSGLGSSRYFGRCTISWTKISSGAACFRLNNSNVYFDDASPSFVTGLSINRKDYIILALMNSSVAKMCLEFFAPTLNFQVGDVKKIPYIPKIETVINTSIIKSCINLSKVDWDCYEMSVNFRHHPLI
jgi:hypothetical protein